MNILKKQGEIVSWLERYGIHDYELIVDEKYGFVVDVFGNVDMLCNNGTGEWVKFGKVDGYFNCTGNSLNSLEFCPEYVGRDFSCVGNNLTSLLGCPRGVGGSFSCQKNRLESLEFSPCFVGGMFECSAELLGGDEIEFCPQSVGKLMAVEEGCQVTKKWHVDFGVVLEKHRDYLARKLRVSLASELAMKKAGGVGAKVKI